jgi:trimeric autotransporter adhesin
MALILKDRVKETTAVTSTGTATLLGAVTGYQSFSAIGNGNTCYYTIAAQTTNEWEVGIGTYTSPDQLSRDTVLSSSNSGSLVNFSAGTKDVFVTQPSSKAVYTDASNIVNTSGNGANTVAFTNINASNVVMVSGTISTNAANATDITNKTYVDNLFSTGITYHDPVLVESPIALNALYNQPGGAGNGVGATLTNNGANAALVVDGVTLSNTARVLVYQQSNAVQNGVYTVTNPGNVSAQWVLTRATDADTYGVGDPNKLGQGDAFFVQSGNTGAGETYILNTVGTITFGTTNLTFAQISSAQVYSAGTGLNLTNLAFSISNTAVTAAQYGNDGAVGQFTVNAQGQITNAANVSINASSISVGTLANGRTTAASANGASTIVSRDTNGSFAANVVTATTVNATSGNFTNITGNAVALTAINASNITSGTIANARTTASDANGASTIVVRDANGAFTSGNITASNFIGAGTTITSINASNISSGTIANARTTAASSNGASTIVSRDSGGNFSANTVTAAVIGDISGGSNINASNISSGTIANARTTASASNGASTIVLRDAGGAFAAGAITGTSFTGNGSALTAINATAITTGTLDNARTTATSANGASTIVVRDANGSFAGNVITGTTGTFTNISGNGTSLTAINASNISSGTVASARISGSYTGITGVGTLTAGTWNANVIANAYTSAATANGASTIVLRGTSGEFSAGAITSVSISGNGVALTAINASNISSGTVATARLASGTANSSTYLRGDQTWATISAGVTITNDTSTNASYYPIFTTASSGSISAANVSTTELTFNPGTNILSAPVVSSSYGFSMNPATLSTSFTIPASFNAVSAGPVTLANGVTITVSTGSAWVVV